MVKISTTYGRNLIVHIIEQAEPWVFTDHIIKFPMSNVIIVTATQVAKHNFVGNNSFRTGMSVLNGGD